MKMKILRTVVCAVRNTSVKKMNKQLLVTCFSSRPSPYEHGIHRSNAESLVNDIPVIEVTGHVAVCDGGGGALGHPVEYIQLDTVSKKPAVCKYCGLRFKLAEGGHHH